MFRDMLARAYSDEGEYSLAAELTRYSLAAELTRYSLAAELTR